MKNKLEVSKAVFLLRRLVDQVSQGGERVIIQDQGKWAAAIVSLEDLAFLDAIDSCRPVSVKK